MRRFKNDIAKILMGVLVLLSLLPMSAQAQTSVVYGVFFYSPTCPHCHDVITNHWPAIQDQFGSQLQVLFIDVTVPAGSEIMGTAINAMHIASHGVPMLIIGSEVLVGSIDIPQRAPGLIRAGLNSGGISYPPIPGIETIFQSMPGHPSPTSTGATEQSGLNDPANVAAVIVLLGLIAGVGLIGAAGWQLMTQRKSQLINTMNGLLGLRMAFFGALVGIGLAGTLVIGSFEDASTLLISGGLLAAFTFIAFHLFWAPSMGQLARWLMPLTIVAGFLIAGYLAYVEITSIEATCGVIGSCNIVHQSSYAYILGIPIAIIGILGYLVIMVLWMANQYRNQRLTDAALFGIALVGVGFSIYLTFVEPFVIGTSCVWCLLSAVVMGLLLWVTAPAGWKAVFAT
jgi:uncharacterized membrane protein